MSTKPHLPFIQPSRVALLLIGLCFLFSGCFLRTGSAPRAQKGVLDLRTYSFAEQVALNGEWEFYWRQFLFPAQNVAKPDMLVDFPFKWNGFRLHGQELPSFGYATYRLRVLLPKKRPSISLAMPDVYSAYHLYINGKLSASNGKISTQPAGYVPHWQYRSVHLPITSDTLDLVLQIANFSHSKGGIKDPLMIGETGQLELARERTTAIDLLLTGCLFMGGLFFLGLFLLGSRDKAILLFSLYSLVYCYRVIGIENYVLHTLLPQLDWYLTIRMEYISLFLGISLFGHYTYYLYPKDINKYVVMGIAAVCYSFSLITLFFSPLYFTQLINPFLLVMVFCIVYIPYVYTVAYRKKRPGSIYALASALALMVVFSISLLHYWGMSTALQLASFSCYISFFFLQSLILSYRVSFVLKSARQEAEQGLTAKSEFLSTMSHEIRTPLNSVIGMSHLLLKNDPRPDQKEHLDVMLFSANNLLSIVNDILDYNKIEAGKITFEQIEMDVRLIVNNIVRGMQGTSTDKGISLRLLVPPALNTGVVGDPTRLSQVITNLVHNAIKFTSRGYVEVGVELVSETDTTLTLLMRVTDTGIGISQSKQQLIFERFTQADSSTSRGFGGTGLGLAISKRILELQNSQLELESEEGKGSTFFFIQTFEKSTSRKITQEAAPLPAEEEKPLTGISILLVEDNPMNVLVAQNYLKRWGATTDVAVNGQEALDKLDPAKHRLVLMDLHMPVMDGYESTRRMRQNGITLPIIALTATLPKEIETQLSEIGMDDIVVKPFLPDELYRRVLHHVFKK